MGDIVTTPIDRLRLNRITGTPTTPPADTVDIWIDDDDGLLYTINESGTIDPVDSGGGGGSGLYSDYLCYRDEKTQNTDGGTFTSGAWRTRTLNTEHADTGAIGSLSSSQITLPAGTYLVFATAPAAQVRRHQLRLRDVTNNVTLATGDSQIAYDTDVTGPTAQCRGRFTLAGTVAIELQHQCEQSFSTFGFGFAANFGTEIFAIVELWKES